MDNNISESLLQAMATMFSDAPQTVIECNIVSCDDPILGSYTVEYQMNKFTAFASANLETPFSAGSGVYVIVPNGDFTKTKYILGASVPGKAAAAISDNIYGADTFVNISDNMLDPSSTYALQSYKTTQAEGSREEVNIDLATTLTSSFVEHFLNDGKRIFHLDFAVKTDLPAEQRNKEDAKYGIIVTFNGENNIPKTWELSTIDMEGSPMAYDIWTKCRLKFEVPEDFVFDSSQNIGIKIYKQDFNVKEDPVDDDILFTNVELHAVRYLSESERNGYYLDISAEASPYFLQPSVNTKKLTATLRANGQKVNSDIDYYWFEEDLSVNSNSEYYVANAGLGWKCINAENSEGQVHNYIPADSYTVLKTKIKGSKQYKCLTVYNNNLVSNTITIVNDDPSAFSFVIDSDAGPAFPQDKGTVKLTARFFYDGVSTVAANIDNIDFNWAFFDSDGKWDNNFPHSTPSAKRQVGDYIEQDILIDSNNIVQMLTAKVNAVVTTAFGDFIVGNQLGTTRLDLIIKALDDVEVNLYNLIMIDSEKVYKYSASGYSPMVTQYEGAVASRVDAIKPISYRIYHQDGTEFNQSEYNACITTWWVPANSLIELDNPPSPQDGYYIITSSGKADLNYNIADFYESSKSDDTIYLSIDFNDYEIKGVAHIQTIKNGELGTNGTSCICTLKARIGGQDEPSFAYQEKDASGKIHSLKLIAFNNAWYVNKADGKFYDRTGIELKLIPYAQRGNDKLTDSDYTASYSMCSNGLTNIVNVNSSTGILTLGDISSVSESNLKNNIVKTVVTVDGWGIPTFYPIEIIRINANAPGVSFYEEDIPLLLGGFNSVQYRSSGYEPLMQPDNNIFEYDDSYLAAAPTWSAESRFDIESNDDQCTVTPKEKRESANLYYYVSASGSLNASPAGITGTITHYKPIIVYNDNYGNETVNGWDGVSLAIDDNNATIMGVMSGWGEKDNQNKFSGVLLGSVKQGNDVQRGILAYNKSDQTFRLDADDGSLHIGKSGKGQIEILPGTDSAKIVGGSYVDAQGTGTGMEIDLAAPSIKWGNRKFKVDPDGTLHATDGVFTGDITATDGEIAGDLKVTGSFIMSDNPADPSQYYVTIEQGEIILYTVCTQGSNGASPYPEDAVYSEDVLFYWNKKTKLARQGFRVENHLYNETIDATTSTNNSEEAYVGMSGIFQEDWNRETIYNKVLQNYHKGIVDINSDGVKLSHFDSPAGNTFNLNNRIYDLRIGHFKPTDEISDFRDIINLYWKDQAAPKIPDECVFLMQDPDVTSDKFLMMANDQLIMVGKNSTSKMSPNLYAVANMLDTDVRTRQTDHAINIRDYFYKKSPYRLNDNPIYELRNNDNVTPGVTDLESGCFIIIYDGEEETKQTINLTILAPPNSSVVIRKKNDDETFTTITTVSINSQGVGTYSGTDLNKYSTYYFNQTVAEIIAKEQTIDCRSFTASVTINSDAANDIVTVTDSQGHVLATVNCPPPN